MIFGDNVSHSWQSVKEGCIPFRFESYGVAFCCPSWPPVVESLFGSGMALLIKFFVIYTFWGH